MKATTPAKTLPILQADVRQQSDAAPCPLRPGDAGLLARVKQRVLGAVARKTGALHSTVRAEGGEWEQVAPGVERKLLWETREAVSCLLRLAPGAVVGAHAHPIDEECVVLEGSVCIGPELLLTVGDFHVGVQGVDHQAASTETGALVYLRGARASPDLVE